MKFNIFRLVRFAVIFAATPAALATAALATTWYVNGVRGSDTNNCLSPTTACKTIGHAISLASSGNSIMVAPATYIELLTISISLNVIGSGASTTIIDGGGVGTVVNIPSPTAHVTLSTLTVRHGFAESSCNPSSPPCPRALGGGIYNSGALIISNSIISGNQAYSNCTPESQNLCSSVGGGIYNQGTLMIKNSTLTGNRAGTGCVFQNECALGGGAFSGSGGTVTLTNSTVEGNSAEVCFVRRCSGTAIVNGFLRNLVMNNSTVSGNSGGIFNLGTATLQNSILGNNSGTSCRGTITSHGYNLSSDGTCNFNGPGDMNNTNPMFGTLGNYGGPTPTIPLLTGSPAIDSGNPSGCTDGQGHLLKTDQRGMPRPNTEDKSGCDMGAYERQSD